jgi:PAS domain S-box-containing protein
MAHGHPADPNECIMFVDSLRRYFHVTDAAAEMLGYTREQLLGRTIDEISAPEMDVAGKFKAYVRDGSQHGVFSLLHRSGDIIHVTYAATVLDDGCMVSRLKKLTTDRDAQQ